MFWQKHGCALLAHTEMPCPPDEESHHPAVQRKNTHLMQAHKLFSFQPSVLRTIWVYPASFEGSAKGKISAFHPC